MKSNAIMSPDGRFRYLLTREWHPETRQHSTPLAFIMLNPSTADAKVDDPTIRKCIGFADRAGADAIAVFNLFALRSTQPKTPGKWTREDIGDQDFEGWFKAGEGMPIVCAWGAGAPDWRVREVVGSVGRGRKLFCLGVTATGHPRHPLYVPYSQPLVEWKGGRG